MKYTVLTMLFGEYDSLKTPKVIDDDAEYICITDNKTLKSDIWNIIYDDCGIPDKEYQGNNVYIRRTYYVRWNWWKYCNTDICVIMDASFLIVSSLHNFINRAYNYDCVIYTHPCRDNIYDEYNTWIEYRGLDKEYMYNFISYTDTFGYNIYTKGLFCTGFMVLKKTFTTISLSQDILYMMKYISDNGDRNDQAYLSYFLNTKYFNCLDIMFLSLEFICTNFLRLFYHNSDIVITEFDKNYCKYQNNKKIHISDFEF